MLRCHVCKVGEMMDPNREPLGGGYTYVHANATAGEYNYRSAIRGAVRGLWAELIDYGQFFDMMLTAIRGGQIAAFTEGSLECGILPADWTPEERMEIESAIAYENSWIAGFAQAIEDGSRAEGGLLGILHQRAEIWIGRYVGLRDKAKAMTCADQKLKWTLGGTANPCRSCLKLDGKVKRASYWNDKGILPRVHGAPYLECQGFRCDCTLAVTDEPQSKGPLPGLP